MQLCGIYHEYTTVVWWLLLFVNQPPEGDTDVLHTHIHILISALWELINEGDIACEQSIQQRVHPQGHECAFFEFI